MTYAIVENGIVINIAESTKPIEPNWYAVPIGASVGIGDTCNGQMFFDPEGNIRYTPEQEQANKLISEQAAEIESLKVALADAQENNDMLTSCILEMSEIIYA